MHVMQWHRRNTNIAFGEFERHPHRVCRSQNIGMRKPDELGLRCRPRCAHQNGRRFSRRQGHETISTPHAFGGFHVDDAAVPVIRGNLVDDDGYACGSGYFHAYRLRFAAQHDIRQQDRVSLVKLVLPELSSRYRTRLRLETHRAQTSREALESTPEDLMRLTQISTLGK